MDSVGKLSLMLMLATSLAGLAACGGGDDEDSGGLQTSLLIVSDEGNDEGVILRYTTKLTQDSGLTGPVQRFDAGLAEGLARDRGRHSYQAGISGTGTVRAICNHPGRVANASFSQARDRRLTTKLTSPKGVAVAQAAGLLLVAEDQAPDYALSLYSLTAGDAEAVRYSIPRSVVGNSGAWGVAYDEAADRLFLALVNGQIAYFAKYLANATTGPGAPGAPALVPTAMFRPANALPASSLRGISYVPAKDTLLVADVGDPTVDTDGSVYIFENASKLSGTVTPVRTLRGAATRLGHPVDVAVMGGRLIVAEKVNAGGQILVFDEALTRSDSDVAPDAVYAVSAPESVLATRTFGAIEPDVSDLSGQALKRLFVTRNAGDAGTEVFNLETGLSTQRNFRAVLASGQFVESVMLDQNGDAILSFDNGVSRGGLSFINRLARRANGGAFDQNRDRQIAGDSTTLVAPKGVEVVGSAGLVLVADQHASGPGAIKAFSLCASGNVAPLFRTPMPVGVQPWDLDYDPMADRLYVAATNGRVLVYDDYLDTRPVKADRVIDPNESGAITSNLHGIVYDADTDRLILSDVGDPASHTDGRIYVLEKASTANGLTFLRLELTGGNTGLGNPVDIAFDGHRLFVAEKGNNRLLRFDNLYAITGLRNEVPSDSLNFAAPESIALSPDFLP